MKKTVLTFGLLSGALIAVLMTITTMFADQIGFGRSIVVGYTIIVASFLFVYFGIRSYRDNVLGGTISFGKGFQAGILITLITCVCYVGSWLVVYYNFIPNFAEEYAAYTVADQRAKGASQAEIDNTIKQGQEMVEMLKNPFLNAAMTFTEPFPVGLVITLISAAVLRKKEA